MPSVLLRPYVDDDAPRVLDILRRPDVVRWLGDPVPMVDLDAAVAWIEDVWCGMLLGHEPSRRVAERLGRPPAAARPL